MSFRNPYTGRTRKLVMGIDIGTTDSCISYALLVPGQITEIRGVTRFPAQEHVGGDSKIPSVLMYDETGIARAVGAEALREVFIERAEDEGWTRVERFKLHLHPKKRDRNQVGSLFLPPNKSIIGIYSDFLKYLYSCTERYIKEDHANGESLWDSVKDNIECIITHPNGWEGAQQDYLRRAAIEAGLINDTPDGQEYLHFLKEGEAVLHFCNRNEMGNDIAHSGQGVVIIDAGKETIEISSFASSPESEEKFEEIADAQCYFQGSDSVTSRAKAYLEEKLKGTRFADDIPNMVTIFDRTTKLRFRSADEPAYIKYGGLGETDPELEIRAGQLSLKSADVAGFFQPCIDAIIEAVLTQYKNSHVPISNVFLVGCLANNDFIFTTVQDALRPFDITVDRPSEHMNRVVANGAVQFYLNKPVPHSFYVTQFDYGVCHNTDYVPTAMASRKQLIYIDAKGAFKVPGRFSVITPKNTEVSGSQSFSYSHCERAATAAALEQCSMIIYSYRGNMDPCPEWLDMDQANFRKHCQITGDLSSVPKLCLGPKYKTYYEVHYNLNISFNSGGEMSAYLTWDEDGIQKSCPAEVSYTAERDIGGEWGS